MKNINTPYTLEGLLAIHKSMCEDAREIIRKKNMDYCVGNAEGTHDPYANFRNSESVGVKGELSILVRVMDKIQRVRSYIERGSLEVKDEGLYDAVQDTINYMILLYGMVQSREALDGVRKELVRDLKSDGVVVSELTETQRDCYEKGSLIYTFPNNVHADAMDAVEESFLTGKQDVTIARIEGNDNIYGYAAKGLA